jgi:ABC-type Zn2+ transport system substrate-binding protein/surface adhesin
LERKKVLLYQSSAKISRTEWHQYWLTGVRTKILLIPLRHTHTHTHTHTHIHTHTHTHTHTHRGTLSCCSLKGTRFLDKPGPERVKENLKLVQDTMYTEHIIP